VWFSLSLILHISVLSCFLLTADKNNRLNRKNNRLIFWKSTKTALCFSFLCFFLYDSSLPFIILSKFLKIFYKQFTPLLFKAIYSNNFIVYKWVQTSPYKLILLGWVRLKVHFLIWYQSHFEPILTIVCWFYQVTCFRSVIRPPIIYSLTHELVASAWGVCVRYLTSTRD